MTQHERGLEFKVGLFVFLGLAMLAGLVVQFGRVNEGFKTYYPLTVRFSDASGLLKGSDVLLAGAKIGRVSDGPRLVREGNGVLVPLRIFDYVNIPDGSKFTVGSSGLLGDRFVHVTMPPGKPAAFVAKGAQINGERETGMDDLTKQGGELVTDLRATVQNINNTVSRLNQEALSPGNMENLKGSFQHLKEAAAALSETSKKVEDVVENAGGAMESLQKDADDLQTVIAEARKLFQDATHGKGLLAALLTDKELAGDLRALISNLRAHGVLFYRDSAAKAEAKAREESAPRRPARGR